MHRLGRIATTAALCTVLLGLIPGLPAHAGAGEYRERHAMLRATNHSRDRFDLAGVHIDRRLSAIARHHSMKMAARESLFHTTNPSNLYLDGKHWHYWGENVGVTGGTAADLENAFMASLPHRHNILNRSFRHVAIGAVRIDGALWVTVFFWG